MKKSVSLALAVFIAFSAFCGIVSADNEILQEMNSETVTGGFIAKKLLKSEGTELINPAEIKTRFSGYPKTVYQYLEEQLLARAETITLYPAYKIDVNSFQAILRTVLFNNYKIMAYDEVGPYYYYGDYFVSFNPTYFTPEEGTESALSMMETEIEKYLDAAEQIPDDDVVGKMLVIHDLFCKNNKYASDELNEEESTHIINNAPRTAYYLFKNKRAVCQGNSIALKAIYDALNERLKKDDKDVIKTSFCSSDNLAHIWNVVEIGGKWYHIDETYDDPVYGDGFGGVMEIPYASHLYFLRAFGSMKDHVAGGINDWVYYTDESVVCDDDKFESGYVFDDLSPKYSFISYESGRYKIDVNSIDIPFWTDGIISTRIFVTDDVEYAGTKTFYYYTNDGIEVTPFYAEYDSNGKLINFNCANKIYISSGFNSKSYLGLPQKCKMFHWTEDDMEPLCRAINIE